MAAPNPKTFLIGTLLYTLLFAGAAEKIGGSDSDNKCGGKERWKVKVVDDDNADKVATGFEETTIANLLTINTTSPANKYAENKPRMEIETHLYKIRHCFITDVLRENDNDLHL